MLYLFIYVCMYVCRKHFLMRELNFLFVEKLMIVVTSDSRRSYYVCCPLLFSYNRRLISNLARVVGKGRRRT